MQFCFGNDPRSLGDCTRVAVARFPGGGGHVDEHAIAGDGVSGRWWGRWCQEPLLSRKGRCSQAYSPRQVAEKAVSARDRFLRNHLVISGVRTLSLRSIGQASLRPIRSASRRRVVADGAVSASDGRGARSSTSTSPGGRLVIWLRSEFRLVQYRRWRTPPFPNEIEGGNYQVPLGLAEGREHPECCFPAWAPAGRPFRLPQRRLYLVTAQIGGRGATRSAKTRGPR
jgi:hypothetical protein